MILSPGIQGVLVRQRESSPLYIIYSPFAYITPRSSPGLINCFNSYEEYIKFWNGTLVYPAIDIKYGFSDPSDLEYFDSQVDAMDASWKAFGEVCLKHQTGQYLPYVGTTATVRDLVAIAEYFDGKGCDINYYGLSYGTTIGNYLINSKPAIPPSPAPILTPSSVFPDRVGRVILDGVEDPITHASKPSYLYWAHRVESVDETFQGFTQGCALAGSYGCPLATNSSTGPGIIEWTKSLLAVCTFVRHSLTPIYASNRSPMITLDQAGMSITSLSTSLAKFTRPSTTPASGPLLLPVISTVFIKESSRSLALTSRSQLARYGPHLSLRDSPVRTGQITLSKPSAAVIPSMRATSLLRLSSTSLFALSRTFPQCVSHPISISSFTIS